MSQNEPNPWPDDMGVRTQLPDGASGDGSVNSVSSAKPPWEASGPIIMRFLRTFRMIATRTEHAFVSMSPVNVLPAVSYACVCLAIILATTIGRDAFDLSFALTAEDVAYYFIGAIVFTAIDLTCVFCLGAIQHLGLCCVGKPRYPILATIKAVFYAHGTAGLFAIIPFWGGWISLGLLLYLTGRGTSALQNITAWKSDLVAAFSVVGFVVMIGLILGELEVNLSRLEGYF